MLLLRVWMLELVAATAAAAAVSAAAVSDAAVSACVHSWWYSATTAVVG